MALVIVSLLTLLIFSINEKSIDGIFKSMEKEGVITENQSSSRDINAITSKFKKAADEYSKSTEKTLSELENM
jgi:DNA-binding PadR family transcriptional regulator